MNPHFGPAAGGGIFDLPTGSWSPLPRPPAASTWPGDMAGALATAAAVYENSAGWVLDVPAERWIEIPQLDNRGNAATTAVGRDLFVFGGDRWNDAGTRGDLADDAWLWTAPSPLRGS
ncbi:MAG TPA: hypothetical protein VGO78_26545 [Acidimicrobiales bacterium]|nr:hypothetical protein [Acidimicrobiales bacterium]